MPIYCLNFNVTEKYQAKHNTEKYIFVGLAFNFHMLKFICIVLSQVSQVMFHWAIYTYLDVDGDLYKCWMNIFCVELCQLKLTDQ